VLDRDPIRFRSSDVRLGEDGGRLTVEGELSMAGSARPVTPQLSERDRREARAGLTQGAAIVVRFELGGALCGRDRFI
jgi:hypothetical protein